MRSLIRVVASSYVGRSHEIKNQPCQDRVHAWKSCDKKSACIALSDGAGSCLHSQIGAEFAVKSIVPFISENFNSFYLDVNAARNAISMHLQSGLKNICANNSFRLRELSATFLFVFIMRKKRNIRYIAGHVGDGVILCNTNNVTSVLSHPINGEYLNTTDFITSPNLTVRFRMYAGIISGRSGFMLMSDGAAESLYVRSNKLPNEVYCNHIFQWCDSFPKRRILKILDVNLSQGIFRQVTHDDCSIAVLRVL